MNKNHQKTDFEKALVSAINKAVRQAKKDGCLGMSINNLRQVTCPPPPYLDGAPQGANRIYDWREMFERIAKDTCAAFIIPNRTEGASQG